MTAHSLRFVFAGTPDFAARHLDGLLALGYRPMAVYTQPDRPVGRGKKIQPTPVKAVAQAHEIPVFQPEKLDADALAGLAQLQPELMVVVAYGSILSQSALDTPRLGCINVHASLLPRWRGAAPIERAILSGDRETGISIMHMEAGLDTGPVLLQLATPIDTADNAATVADRLVTLGIRGLGQVLQDVPGYLASALPQDETQARYAAKLDKEDARLDWNRAAVELQHQVQAFYPRSPAWCWFRGERLRVISACSDIGNSAVPPGTILAVAKTGILVACGTGNLRITHLQLPGKQAAAVGEILNGYPELFVPGTSLAEPQPAQ